MNVNSKPHQAIYGFRGSSATAVEDFIKRFGAKELFLTKNFRSAKNIVEFANASIKRQEAKMDPHDKNTGMLFFKEFRTCKEETTGIVDKIQLLRQA